MEDSRIQFEGFSPSSFMVYFKDLFELSRFSRALTGDTDTWEKSYVSESK